MKLFFRIILLVALFILPGCNRNRLKTNEKALINKLKLDEREQYISDSLTKLQGAKNRAGGLAGGLLYKEDRSVDPSDPPLKLDISGSLENIANTKLSDIASEITYIRMAPIPDTTIPSNIKFRYYLMDNYIVAANIYGIHIYASDGRYTRQIVKNEMTGVEVTADGIKFWSDYTMKGGTGIVGAKGNSLFYNYTNNITGQKYIMVYDCSSTQLIPDYRFDPENPDRISGLGEIQIDLNHGNTKPPPPQKHQGMFGGRHEGFYYTASVHILNADSYTSPVHDEKNMLVVLNNQGDTLSKFTLKEKLVNYTKTLQRGTDGGTQYEEDGLLYIRPAFNDTVFRITPPNRMTPVYILNLGSYKVARQQGVDPDFELTGKIIPGDWAETKDFIFMTYTRDDYDCPNTRKNKTVKIYHAIFSKLNHQFSVIKGDPYDYSPEILENNIDGGVPVWPAFYMVSKNGEILISLKGRELKDRVKSDEFSLSKAPEAKKKELEKLAASVDGNEDILMIVK
jgi:hypothetical protein